MSIYEYMEDYDNDELPSEEWREQMEEAIKLYYQDNPDAYKFKKTENVIRNYLGWKREKQFG